MQGRQKSKRGTGNRTNYFFKSTVFFLPTKSTLAMAQTISMANCIKFNKNFFDNSINPRATIIRLAVAIDKAADFLGKINLIFET